MLGKLTNIDKVDIGMVLDRDLIDSKTGAILIADGTAMTRNLIDKLISNKVRAVFIREELIPEGWKNESIAKEYSKVEKSLDNIFTEVQTGKNIESEKIEKEMEYFVNAISSERDILTQMRLLHKKDDYTFDHSLGVSVLAIALGKWLDYSEEKILDLSIAALFHDIGKLRVPDEIVKKPARLTTEECSIMQRHSYYSYEMLAQTNKFNDDILLGVLQHHERMNGVGYPNGVKGDKIHEYAKIIAICDIYHAITSRRVYKDKDSPLRAADYLRRESFTSLDPYITQIFLKNISKFYVGNKVLISDGTTGIIVYIHPQDETKPMVKVGEEFIDFQKEQDVEILDIII
jgi:HD-GYP domain-containing protein (c-di-GMP phosphodiesterase class II)